MPPVAGHLMSPSAPRPLVSLGTCMGAASGIFQPNSPLRRPGPDGRHKAQYVRTSLALPAFWNAVFRRNPVRLMSYDCIQHRPLGITTSTNRRANNEQCTTVGQKGFSGLC